MGNILKSAFALTFTAAITLFIFTNCGKATDTTAATPLMPTDVFTILSSKCIQCHQPGGSATAQYNVTLDFTTAALAYSTLTSSGVNSALTKTVCTGVKQVVAGSPTTSYMLAMIISSYNTGNFAGKTGCNPSAHYTTNPVTITTAEQTTLVSWIQNGAKSQ